MVLSTALYCPRLEVRQFPEERRQDRETILLFRGAEHCVLKENPAGLSVLELLTELSRGAAPYWPRFISFRTGQYRRSRCVPVMYMIRAPDYTEQANDTAHSRR